MRPLMETLRIILLRARYSATVLEQAVDMVHVGKAFPASSGYRPDFEGNYFRGFCPPSVWGRFLALKWTCVFRDMVRCRLVLLAIWFDVRRFV